MAGNPGDVDSRSRAWGPSFRDSGRTPTRRPRGSIVPSTRSTRHAPPRPTLSCHGAASRRRVIVHAARALGKWHERRVAAPVATRLEQENLETARPHFSAALCGIGGPDASAILLIRTPRSTRAPRLRTVRTCEDGSGTRAHRSCGSSPEKHRRCLRQRLPSSDASGRIAGSEQHAPSHDVCHADRDIPRCVWRHYCDAGEDWPRLLT
jgi:hypothetical protein